MNRTTSVFGMAATPGGGQVSGQMAAQKPSWWMRERLGAPMVAHLAFIALSALLWFWSYRQLTDELTIDSRATLVLIKGEAAKEWTMVERSTDRVSLLVSGPRERLDRVQSDLAVARERATFEYLVPHSVFEVPATQDRIVVDVALRQFGALAGVGVPDQVEVRFAEPEEIVSFVLERSVVRAAGVDWSAISHSPAWQLSAKLTKPLSVRGGASRVASVAQPDGRLMARIEPLDLMGDLEAASVGLDSTARRALFGKPRVIRVRLIPVQGVEFVEQDADGDFSAVSDVEAEVHLSPSASYVEVSIELDVAYLQPAWMSENRVETMPIGPWRKLIVSLRVSAAQAKDFDEAGVRLVCDLTSLAQGEAEFASSGNELPFLVIAPRKFPVRLEVADRARFDWQLTETAREEGRSDKNIAEVELGFRWRARSGG